MKIGRNDPCLCGSGKKYKRCCAGKPEKSGRRSAPEKQPKITLGSFIENFQGHAIRKKEAIGQVGVFLLYADTDGNAWVLEMTQADAIQVAESGEPLEVPLEENDQTIVVDWSHTFAFRNRKLVVTSYRGREQLVLESAPTQQLHAVYRKFVKKLSPEMIEQVHIDG